MAETNCLSLQASTGRYVHAGCDNPHKTSAPSGQDPNGLICFCAGHMGWFQLNILWRRSGETATILGAPDESSSENNFTLEVLLDSLPLSWRILCATL